MKIFLDSASIGEIEEINDLGIIDGITTNPTLMAKEGKDPREVVERISKIISGDISVEVAANKFNRMLQEANKILDFAENIVVKLPMTWDGVRACKYLTSKNHKVNMTLCFTANQALIAAKAGATYVSPFIGRLDDIGEDGINLVQNIKHIYNSHQFNTKILASSVRSTLHFYKAAASGADVATLSGKIIKQLMNHPLTDLGLEIFDRDWKKSNLTI
jgi:transaldolase